MILRFFLFKWNSSFLLHYRILGVPFRVSYASQCAIGRNNHRKIKKTENVIQYIALHCVHAIRFALRECVFNSMLNNWDEKYRNNDGNSGVSKFDEQTKNWKLSDLIEQIERRIMLIWCWNIFTIRQHTLARLHWISSECYSTGRRRRRTAKRRKKNTVFTSLYSSTLHPYAWIFHWMNGHYSNAILCPQNLFMSRKLGVRRWVVAVVWTWTFGRRCRSAAVYMTVCDDRVQIHS